MTTFQESQPQSRRAARQSERGESAEQADFTGEQPDAPQTYSPDSAAVGAWSAPDGAAESAPKGRRAAAPAGPPSAVTEQIAIVDQADALAAAEHPVVEPGLENFPPTQAIQQTDRPAYRVRDYSPEGRRSSVPSAAGWMPAAADTAQPSAVDNAPTVTAFSPPAASALAGVRPQFFVPESALQDTIVPPAPATSTPESETTAVDETDVPLAPAPAFVIPEHTMTRRELRALEAQQLAAQQLGEQSPPRLPEFAPDGSLTGAAAAVFVETTFNDDNDGDAEAESLPAAESAPAESDVTSTPPPLVDPTIPAGSAEEIAADDAAAVDEVAFAAPALSPFDSLFQVPPAAPTVAPADLLSPVPADSTDAASPTPLVDPLLPPVAPAAEESPALSDALAEFDALTRVPAEDGSRDVENAAVPVAPTESHWTPPTGHWSAQDDVDEDGPAEGTISRTIGSGISTTNALVLPSIPDGADIRGPLTGAGEIMLTGSIDLPRNLSSTGQSDRFDGESMDALFDLNDAEVISTDSSPVRAIRAVSTHASAHGVTHTQKPKGTKALTGLLIAASSLAVVVAGLLVAAFAFNVF